MSAERVLCVDDDEQVRALIRRVVVAAGYKCTGVGTVDDARRLLADEEFSVVLCDIGLAGSSGLELLDELGRTRPDIATIMVTGHDHVGIVDAALKLGAYGYITKPFAPNDLMIDISNALHRRRLEASAVRRRRLRCSARTREHSAGSAARSSITTGRRARISSAWARIRPTLRLRSDSPRRGSSCCGWPRRCTTSARSRSRDQILRKTGMLTDDERHVMEQHTEIGRDLLGGSGSELLELAATIAWTHHERWDGSGYPRGLEGEEIPLEGASSRSPTCSTRSRAIGRTALGSRSRMRAPGFSKAPARVRPGRRRGVRALFGTGGSMSITCVIADDHPPVLQFLSRYLSNNGITMTASARDGDEALRKIVETKPTVAVLDSRMPRVSGLDVLRALTASESSTRVILYTGYGDDALLSDALDAGVAGVLDKEAPPDDLLRAIKIVAEGGSYLDPIAAAALIQQRRRNRNRELTQREREVLRCSPRGTRTSRSARC